MFSSAPRPLDETKLKSAEKPFYFVSGFIFFQVQNIGVLFIMKQILDWFQVTDERILICG